MVIPHNWSNINDIYIISTFYYLPLYSISIHNSNKWKVPSATTKTENPSSIGNRTTLSCTRLHPISNPLPTHPKMATIPESSIPPKNNKLDSHIDPNQWPEWTNLWPFQSLLPSSLLRKMLIVRYVIDHYHLCLWCNLRGHRLDNWGQATWRQNRWT